MMIYNNKQDFKLLDDDVLMREYEGVKDKLANLLDESMSGYIGFDTSQWLPVYSNALQRLHLVTAELRRRGQQVY